MAEKYVDMVNIFIGTFPDGPLPDNFKEGQALAFGVGGKINRDDLMEAIEEELRPKPFHVADRYSHFSWGADGAALEIIIGVASGAAGGAVGALIERLLGDAGGHRTGAKEMNAEQAGDRVRESLARFLDARPSSINVEGVEDKRYGYRVELRKGKARFVAKLDSEGLISIKKQKRK